MSRERREIWYAGRVQGVGFRYTVANLARQYALGGFVRNLPDGRVHLVCEGETDEIESLAAEIVDRMGGYVTNVKEDRRPPVGGFVGFEIRY